MLLSDSVAYPFATVLKDTVVFRLIDFLQYDQYLDPFRGTRSQQKNDLLENTGP